MKANWLTVTLLQAPKLVLITNEASYRREMRRLGIDTPTAFVSSGSNATTHLLSRMSELTALVCVLVDKRDSRVQYHMILVHEAVHVWKACCKAINELAPGSEVEAYAIQSISQVLIVEFERLTKGIRFKRK